MSSQIVKAQDVTKEFSVLSQRIALRRILRDWREGKSLFTELSAVKDLSFTVEKGERVGVVGHNGAGKTTLLRMIAGIYKPTSGHLAVVEEPVALFNYWLGLARELRVEENLNLIAAIFGKNREEVSLVVEEIYEFAELSRCRSMYMKDLSLGQLQRFILSIFLHSDFSFFIIDESFSHLDIKFSNKCRERLSQIVTEGVTGMLASHDLDFLCDICNKGLLLSGGRLVMSGDIGDVVEEYRRL